MGKDKTMKKYGMRFANNKRTVCEVLRDINDLCQDENQTEIRKLLYEAEYMCKRMALKLKEYNKDWDAEWWAANPEYEKKLDERMKKSYIVGNEE